MKKTTPPITKTWKKTLKAGHLMLGWGQLSSRPPLGFHETPGTTGPPQPSHTPFWLQDKESHLLTIARTGTGKNRCALNPAALTYPGSLVVTDIKGEIAHVCARIRRDMGQNVIMLDPWRCYTGKPDSLNPCDTLPLTGHGLEEFSLAVPSLLHPDHKQTLQEQFWDNQADALISGTTCAILSVEPPARRNFSHLRTLLMADDAILQLAMLMDAHAKNMPKMASQQIGSFLTTEDKCRSGILSTAVQHLRIMGDPLVENSISTTSFSLEAFRDGAPTTIFLIIPPNRLASHGMLLRMWIATLLEVTMSRTSTPALPTLFLLDEVAQLGRLQSLVTAVTLMRGYGIRCWLFLQSLNQLKSLYPDCWQTLTDNVGAIQAFGIANHPMARDLADLMGVAQPHELLDLRSDEQMILTSGGHTHLTRKLDYLKDPLFAGLWDANPRYATQDALGR